MRSFYLAVSAAILLSGAAAAQSTGATDAPANPASVLAGAWIFRQSGAEASAGGGGCVVELTSEPVMTSYRMRVSDRCMSAYSLFMGAYQWMPSSSKIFRLAVGRLGEQLMFQQRKDGVYRATFSQDGKDYVMTRAEPETAPAPQP